MKKTFILDNGAYEIKAGYAGSTPSYPSQLPLTHSSNPSLIPNCIARSKGDRRVYVGEQLRNCKDFGALAFRRPFERVPPPNTFPCGARFAVFVAGADG